MAFRPFAHLLLPALVLVPTAALATQPLGLSDLSEERRHHVRCTMAAGAIVHDFERGATTESHGLGQRDIERLGESLADALAAEHGADAETTRALLRADFESYTSELANATEQEAQARAREIAAGCRSLWSGPAPLPPAPAYYGKPVDAPFCFALNSIFSQGTRDPAGRDTALSMAFARRANRIETAMLEKAGDDEATRQAVQDSLRAGMDGFDTVAWDALKEEPAEAIMVWCEQLAGPED